MARSKPIAGSGKANLLPLPTEQFLAGVEQLSVPVMVVIGEQAPPSSKAEMEAIAALPNVQTVRLPGTLGMVEEYGEEVATTALPFLQTVNN